MKRTSPFLTGRLFSTGTSMTRPRTCDTTGTTYLTTRTSPRRRRDDIQEEQQRGDRHDREDRDRDLPRRVPRQQLELDEDQPDEEGVDPEEDEFHYAAPCRGELGLERVDVRAQRLQIGGGNALRLETREPVVEAAVASFARARDAACRCRRPSCARPASSRPRARRSARAARRTPATAGTACGSPRTADGCACARSARAGCGPARRSRSAPPAPRR